VLLEILVIVVLAVAVISLAAQVFGSQVLGVPAMVALLAFIALTRALSRDGLLAVLGALVGVLAIWLAIGMAMTHGAKDYVSADEEKPDSD
jgi:hypothetical protein